MMMIKYLTIHISKHRYASFTRTGLGYSMVITNAIIGLYYNVIIAWAAYFLLTSVTNYLPWTDCNNS